MKLWKNLFNSHTHINDKLLFVLAGVGASSMVYQFSVISALTFILGDSLTLFSIFSGTFLFSMGLGAALAETHKNYEMQFIRSQISLAVVGFLVLPVIFILHALMATEIRHLYSSGDRILINALWGIGLFSELIFGSLIGLQLPLLQKIIYKKSQYKMPLSKILTVDYLGSFFGAVAFPLLLLPYLGLFRAVFSAALVNSLLCLLSIQALGLENKKQMIFCSILSILIILSFWQSPSLEFIIDSIIYEKI